MRLLLALLLSSTLWTSSGDLTVRWRADTPPILVVPHPEVRHWVPALEAAARHLNKRLGASLLLVLPTAVLDPVRVSLYSGPVMALPHEDNVTHIWWDKTGDVKVMLIGLDTMETRPSVQYLVALHEFGHVLGLDHDDPAVQPHSMMVPTITNADADLEFTDEDMEALRCWYLQECRNAAPAQPPIPADETPPIPRSWTRMQECRY